MISGRSSFRPLDLPNKLHVELVMKYRCQPMRFSTSCASSHDVCSPQGYFYLPKQNYTAEVNCLVALHELYKYINKYYDQVSARVQETGNRHTPPSAGCVNAAL